MEWKMMLMSRSHLSLDTFFNGHGYLREAERMYERALQGYEKALGPRKIGQYVPALNTAYNLGILFQNVGQPGEAKHMF